MAQAYRKLSPKELVALGKSPKAENYINAKGDIISKRQYQKQNQLGQYNKQPTKNAQKQAAGRAGAKARQTISKIGKENYLKSKIVTRQLIDTLNQKESNALKAKRYKLLKQLGGILPAQDILDFKKILYPG